LFIATVHQRIGISEYVIEPPSPGARFWNI
jgi:hypothetical protein